MPILPAILGAGSLVAGLFGGGPNFKTMPWAQQTSDMLDPILGGIQHDINNFKKGPAHRFLRLGMKSLNSGEDFSRNPAAAGYLNMRAAERATQARAIARRAQQMAASLPQGAEHLTAVVQQQLQNDADQTNALQDAAGVANVITALPGMFQQVKESNASILGNLRNQYMSGVGQKADILRSGTYQQPSFMSRLAQGIGGGLSMLPFFMKPGFTPNNAAQGAFGYLAGWNRK